MSIPVNSECYLCHLRRYLDIARSLGTDETASAFAKDLMQLYLSAPEGISSPEFCPASEALLDKYYHTGEDRFREEKARSNAFVLPLLSKVQADAESAEDPVYAAMQYAVLGNYIDFSALHGEVSFETLEKLLQKARTLFLDKAAYGQFCEELRTGKKLLYLTDNAGEIGFDRVLGEILQKHYPHLQITFCVRGGPAHNDATREDASAVGVPFPVIDNGNTVPGTKLELLGADARQAMSEADVILSKGQGNVETLLGCGYNIYYLFLVKCSRFIQLFDKEKLTPMLLQERK